MRERITALAEQHGLQLVGLAPAQRAPEAEQRMRDAVDAGRMARMGWMGGERPALATDPARHDPAAATIIVVAAPYAGEDRRSWDAGSGSLPEPLERALGAEPARPTGLVARYALGTDYHLALRERLAAFADDLSQIGVRTSARSFVDDRPFAERAFAAQGGIGWIGKNTNLLTHHRAGSWVFLGALLSSTSVDPDPPLRSSCGACRRCLDGCPTGALVAPYTIDAGRCISYLTIEHPGELDAAAAQAIGEWIFGCDVCQEVCPVNAEADDGGPLPVPLAPLAEILLEMGARSFQRAFAGSAIQRAGRHRLLRNVLAALANAVDEGKVPPDADPATRRVAQRAAADRRPEVRAAADRLSVALEARRTVLLGRRG